nr:Chain C, PHOSPHOSPROTEIN [Human orthopneumovirus]4UCB_D Chain D, PHOSPHOSPROTEIN [Human orthopneumovirus]
DLSLEDF